MEGRLSRQLLDKIAQFDISQPYVWRLRLSEADFNELEIWLKSIVETKGVCVLAKSENAVTTIIYMAEWYKRRYQSGNKNMLIDGVDYKTLWENSGISLKNYLYKDDNGTARLMYSIYVLGGLAIQHELNRNDKMRFLKGLCRIYHGEDYTLENIDDESRAIAFRESIKRQHSLYEYLREILNGNMPFHQDDLGNEHSDVNRFVATIKAANDDIFRSKFRLEWAVTFSPDYTYMTRRLRCWLKPEEVGGGSHQYLRYDRVHLWGVPNPENLQRLYVYVRFKNGDSVVEPQTMESPIITYLNHGVNDFVTLGVERGVQVKNVPSCRFDKIEVVVKDDSGNEYIAQTQDTTEYIQLWRAEAYGYTWTSTQNAQKQTALLFSNGCQLKDSSLSIDVYRKQFRDQQYGVSETWNWVYIYDSITFVDDKGKEITLFNRIGFDQVTTRLYTNTIHYVNGGNIRHYYIDDPDISEEYDVDELPVIFGKEDVVVRHFATRDDIVNSCPEEDTQIQGIEYKKTNGDYTLWTDENEPPYGDVTLRITAKNQRYKMNVAYLPCLSTSIPIARDYDAECIRYRDFSKQESAQQDMIPMDGIMLEPTRPVKFGEGDSYYEVDVYRPTLIKEVLLDGRIVKYLHGEEKLELPYIFKQRVQLNDFSKHGYQAYECKNMRSIYSDDFLNISGNPSVGMAAIVKWTENAKYVGKLFDTMAPDCLIVSFGLSKEDANWEGQEALVWNYDKGVEPQVASHTDTPDFGIIFQDLSKNTDLTCNYPLQFDDGPWGFDGIDVSIIRCFEIANETRTYFFLMQPLREMMERGGNVIKELYEPLFDVRRGNLTNKDKEGLICFGEEFGFDWHKHGINIDNE